MEKTFDVVGITKNTIIFKGITLMPKERFSFPLSESELQFFKQFVNIVECNEIIKVDKPATQEPTPETNSEPKIEEEHKEVPSDKTRTVRKTQNKSKKQV